MIFSTGMQFTFTNPKGETLTQEITDVKNNHLFRGDMVVGTYITTKILGTERTANFSATRLHRLLESSDNSFTPLNF
jgi:hypothetical protein